MKTLLFIEDDKVISKKLKLAFEAELGDSIRVLCVHTGKEALEMIEVTQIDIFILDLKLPDCDGIELAKQIRETHLKSLMMIASSVDDLRTQVNANNELDIFLYVTKPYSPNELIPSIKSALKRLDTPTEKFITLKRGAKVFKINLNDVILVEKVKGDKQIEVHMFDEKQGKTFSKIFPMQSLEKFNSLLNDPRDLIRVNQSVFLNPKFVEYYDGLENEVHLKHTDHLIMIGRTFKDNVKLLLK